MRNDFEPKHLQRAKDNLSKSLEVYESAAQQNKLTQKEQRKKRTFWERVKGLFIR